MTEEWYAQREALYDVRSEARRTRHGLIESEHRCTQLMLALSDAGVSVDPNLFVGSNSAAALLVLPAPSSTDPRDVDEDIDDAEADDDATSPPLTPSHGIDGRGPRGNVDMSFEGDDGGRTGDCSIGVVAGDDGFQDAVSALASSAHAYGTLSNTTRGGDSKHRPSPAEALYAMSQYSAHRFAADAASDGSAV